MCFAQNSAHFFKIFASKPAPIMAVLCTCLRNSLRTTMPCTFSSSQLPKVLQEWCALYMSTSTRASRHNALHFFIISTSRKCPSIACLAHFGLRHVLRAATACNCSFLILPDGSAPAALASLLVDSLEPQNHWKTPRLATFL